MFVKFVDLYFKVDGKHTLVESIAYNGGICEAVAPLKKYKQRISDSVIRVGAVFRRSFSVHSI